ncbi:hypothetical protein [Candidatus Enterococcus courvalinii]|uniref:YlaH-like protein n=1 Tax=Candidatus Enterococcus courvalinii TaxID=2815329 RepID=A0ABS3HYF7_9ENTE|nr:hypothetical protein [Enterococcus sp. MSG2901]MBO0481450.1 hypothetical protein [Enterococcus sp. MSG2901]
MEKLIAIAQSLLDGLKWLLEGSNWLILLPFICVSFYIMYQMVKRKEKGLILVWYLATVAIGSLMLQIAVDTQVALIFAAVLIGLYVVIYIRYLGHRMHLIKKGKHAARYRSIKE